MKIDRNVLKNVWKFFQLVFTNWDQDNCFRLSAALSYYTIFSIAPVILMVIATAGYFLGEEAISGLIFARISNIVGASSALAVQSVVQNAYVGRPNSISTWVAVATLIFSSTVVVTALQNSLNTIWKVQVRPDRSIVNFLLKKLVAIGLIILFGVILTASVLVSTIISGFYQFLSGYLGEVSFLLLQYSQHGLNLFVLTLLFAVVFKFLPDAKIKWSWVWLGAIVTSVLFMIGKSVIAYYLAHSKLDSVYGAAGSIIILIVWINYSSWIFFFGAEVAYSTVKMKGIDVKAGRYAVKYKVSIES